MNLFWRSKHPRLSHRFAMLVGLFGLGFVFFGAWSFKTLTEVQVGSGLYTRIVQSKDLIADILPPPAYILESYLVTLQLLHGAEPAAQDKLIERLATQKKEYDARHEYWIGRNLEKELDVLLAKDAHDPAVAFYDMAFKEFVPALRERNNQAASAAMARMSEVYERHRLAIDRAVQLAAARASGDETHAASRIRSAEILLFAILVLSLGVATWVAIVIARAVIAPLSAATAAARRIADGDLSGEVGRATGTQETAMLIESLSAMQDTLRKITTDIRNAASNVDARSGEIARGNADLSSRTEQQASSLEETTASLEELTSTVQKNAENVRKVNQKMTEASEIAVRGGGVVRDVVVTMSGISGSSKKIADIISVIDSIAFQTNILALNAAVEAARAGEQGRGFAVVAGEVRNLAQRSAAAAKEIKELISTSVAKVDTGGKLVDQAGKTMNEVVTAVKRLTEIMGQITGASQEQSSGLDQINQAIVQMDQMTQQNTALVEEAAAAAESLSEEAHNLLKAASAFKMGDDIAATASAGRRGPDRARNVARLTAKPTAAEEQRLAANG
jgi:methyl-accepting chemotaxis protein